MVNEKGIPGDQMVIKGQWTSECTSCGNWQPELISSPDSPIVTAKASSN